MLLYNLFAIILLIRHSVYTRVIRFFMYSTATFHYFLVHYFASNRHYKYTFIYFQQVHQVHQYNDAMKQKHVENH